MHWSEYVMITNHQIQTKGQVLGIVTIFPEFFLAKCPIQA